MTYPVVHRAAALDLAFAPRRCRLRTSGARRSTRISPRGSARRRSGMAACWWRTIRSSPGRALRQLLRDRFASYLAWRDWGFPDPDVFSAPVIGALRCSDGAFILGEMSGHTANAGRIYFPAGNARSRRYPRWRGPISPATIAREVEEETGLTPARLSRRARTGIAWVGEGSLR